MALRSIESFKPEIIDQPWGTETLVCETPEYTGKMLCYRAGEAGGFQYHMKKDESFYMYRGQGIVRYDDGVSMKEVVMTDGQTFHIPIGAPHQFQAITDCTVFEASTPSTNDRVNVGDRYGLPPAPGTLPTTYTQEEIDAFEAKL